MLRPTTFRTGSSWVSIQNISTKDEFRLHSRYIRETLAPMLANSGTSLPASEVYPLESILARTAATTVNLNHLRYSHIEKALMLLVNTDERTFWPTNSIAKAKMLLKKWEGDVRSLENLRADLFAEDGRLERTFKASYWNNGTVTHNKVGPII